VGQKSQNEPKLHKLQMYPPDMAQHHRVDVPAFHSFPLCASFLGDCSDVLHRHGFVAYENVATTALHVTALND